MHINASAIEKVVLFGDSLMAGYGLPNEHHLSVVLEDNFKKDGLNIKIINSSVSGSTSSLTSNHPITIIIWFNISIWINTVNFCNAR